jgi:hypothetical protein
MVVGFKTTYEINAYHHSDVLKSLLKLECDLLENMMEILFCRLLKVLNVLSVRNQRWPSLHVMI